MKPHNELNPLEAEQSLSTTLGNTRVASDAAPAISPSVRPLTGPWSVSTGDKTIINSPERYVCEVFDWSAKETAPQYQDINDKLHAESVANARLIASAPCLLAALQELLELLPPEQTRSWIKAKQAVTKATL